MKILSAILSVYILALALMPCEDVMIWNEIPGVYVTSETHSHGIDTCSPFCICSCCQAHANVAADPQTEYFTEVCVNYQVYILNYTGSEPSEFLIPPERS